MNGAPLTNYDMYHPSLFQIQEVWDKAQQGKKPAGAIVPETVKRLDAILSNSADSCVTSSDASREKPTLLRFLYFSDANVKGVLAHNLRAEVYAKCGKVIGDQSGPNMIEVVNAVYDEYARHINERATPWPELQNYMKSEIDRLNRIALDILVPRVLENIFLHARYLEAINKPNTPSERPTFTTFKDTTVQNTRLFTNSDDVRIPGTFMGA